MNIMEIELNSQFVFQTNKIRRLGFSKKKIPTTFVLTGEVLNVFLEGEPILTQVPFNGFLHVIGMKGFDNAELEFHPRLHGLKSVRMQHSSNELITT